MGTEATHRPSEVEQSTEIVQNPEGLLENVLKVLLAGGVSPDLIRTKVATVLDDPRSTGSKVK